MAVTQNTYTGNGSTVLYSFTFPYLKTTDIKVSVNGTVVTTYTFANATTIQFNTAPTNGAAIRIYRETDDSALAATFYPGSAIRSQDLNENFTQNLYVTQESSNTATTANTTANSAVTTANTALSNSTTAISTANSASASAASAVSTATQAASDAASAVSTATAASAAATQASTDSAAAVSTAKTAASQVAGAVSTANSAAADAASALSASAAATATANSALSTANTASTNASAAVSTANTANTNATAALNAVANSVQYTLVANVAAIPVSPADGDAIEIADSTNVESFTPLANIPAGYVGDTGLSVRIQYSSANSTWNWLNYFPNNAESRYLKLSGGTLTGLLTLNADPTQNLEAATKQYVDNVANSGGLPLTGGTMTGQILGDNSTSPATPGYAFDGDANTGLYTTGADELALSTGGVARVTIDSAGAVSVTNSLSVGGQAAVVTNDARLTDARTPTDGSVTDAKVSASAAIAGSKISPDFGSQNISTTGTLTTGAITLPNTDGTTGQVLSTDGSGTLSWATAAAGGASVTTSDTAPVSPSDGDLWYDSVGGRTYVYYEDPNSSQWVDIAPQGGGGGGASVTASDTAPASPTAGDLWYDSVAGKLYVYYTDADSSQWVQTNGGSGGGTSLWTQGSGVVIPATPTDLVQVNGIKFPATAVASADPNTLDDYEEGTWTPSAGNFTVSGSSTLTGVYTKSGRIVYFSVKFQTTGTIAHSTSANISLPFSPPFGSVPSGFVAMYVGNSSESFTSGKSGTQNSIDTEGAARFFVGNFTTTSSGQTLSFSGFYRVS